MKVALKRLALNPLQLKASPFRAGMMPKGL